MNIVPLPQHLYGGTQKGGNTLLGSQPAGKNDEFVVANPELLPFRVHSRLLQSSRIEDSWVQPIMNYIHLGVVNPVTGDDLSFERTANGNHLVSPPAGIALVSDDLF